MVPLRNTNWCLRVCRNEAVTAALASGGLLPGPPEGVSNLLKKSTIMTVRGPAVLLSSLDPSVHKVEAPEGDAEEEGLDGPGAADEPRSVVAQMLYARWIMSLRESRESSVSFVIFAGS